MTYATFVAITDKGVHIAHSSAQPSFFEANRWCHIQARHQTLGHKVVKFWYMLGDHECQEYTPEEFVDFIQT